MSQIDSAQPAARPFSVATLAYLAAVGLLTLVLLYAAWTVYLIGQPLFGVVLTLVALGLFFIFGFRRYYFARFIFPGIATMALFVVFPILYTIYLGFTNYGSFNLLTFERAQEVILSRKTVDPATAQPFAVAAEGDAYRIYFGDDTGGFLSDPVALDGTPASVAASPVPAPPADLLERRAAVQLRTGLAEVEVTLPDGTPLRNAGLREFASVTPEYTLQQDGSLLQVATGAILTPDHDTGFYVTDAGETVPPGWRTNIGFANFERILTSDGIRAPMARIFIWTVVFAVASVVLTFAIGLTLAVILQWEHMRFKAAYRILLILPYAVPGFISILVFKGLFNQNFGEINMILEALFGLRPDWNTDGTLARIMILTVNTWLGYPYMMLLAMGFLQSVPAEQKRAAYLEGAGPVRVFFTITLPQILPPFLPLLLASFAFNFNNLVLVLLLTRGGPDIPGTIIPAGETDILGSFTYRIAFIDSGTQFGLAGAITLLIFLLVSLIAYANFVAMRRATAKV
ncbi:maltose ABC transporter permease MalF [Loktanella sp. IMCC34160]|uniref:maltose ABC transporter permease MalF n=1 Tax=Loktanella sp. IMCC34160 TaxID=2510646 RepID=UPI00101D545E|nr:maltose ABC transporter permease MalF [Loktanella sp. IMCC34160]RYG93053.1 maltose ABC transporter permease MalF [Loktanella sp. IMCC34160]